MHPHMKRNIVFASLHTLAICRRSFFGHTCIYCFYTFPAARSRCYSATIFGDPQSFTNHALRTVPSVHPETAVRHQAIKSLGYANLFVLPLQDERLFFDCLTDGFG